MTITNELQRRKGKTAQVLELFMSKPNFWIDIRTIAHVGGFAAWRTRISNARVIAERSGFTIEWNGKISESAYRYRPIPIGPSAETPRTQRGLF